MTECKVNIWLSGFSGKTPGIILHCTEGSRDIWPSSMCNCMFVYSSFLWPHKAGVQTIILLCRGCNVTQVLNTSHKWRYCASNTGNANDDLRLALFIATEIAAQDTRDLQLPTCEILGLDAHMTADGVRCWSVGTWHLGAGEWIRE
jgi:hypothetical protein